MRTPLPERYSGKRPSGMNEQLTYLCKLVRILVIELAVFIAVVGLGLVLYK